MSMPVDQQKFDTEDDEAQYALTILRDGTHRQKLRARTQLACIFERRGMLDEAVALLESNASAGVRSRELFLSLARLHQARGDELASMGAAVEAAKCQSGEPRSPDPDRTAAFERSTEQSFTARQSVTQSRRARPSFRVPIHWKIRLLGVSLAAAVLILFFVLRMVFQSGTQGASTAAVDRTTVITPTITSAPRAAAKPQPPTPPLAAKPVQSPTPSEDEIKAGFRAGLDSAWQRGDWVHAIQAAQLLLNYSPDDPEIQEKLFAARINRADQLVKEGKPSEAVVLYQAASGGQSNPIVESRLIALTPTASGVDGVAGYLSWLDSELGTVKQATTALSSQLALASQRPALIRDNDWKIRTGFALGVLQVEGEKLRTGPPIVPNGAQPSLPIVGETREID